MKIGIECEGRLKGIRTLFVAASDVMDAEGINRVQNALLRNSLRHLYISDRDNVLDYSVIGTYFSHYLVTMDVTKVRSTRPHNVTIMLTLPYELYDSVAQLTGDDQIKFHSVQRNVACVTARNLVHTDPSEFSGDVEV